MNACIAYIHNRKYNAFPVSTQDGKYIFCLPKRKKKKENPMLVVVQSIPWKSYLCMQECGKKHRLLREFQL